MSKRDIGRFPAGLFLAMAYARDGDHALSGLGMRVLSFFTTWSTPRESDTEHVVVHQHDWFLWLLAF